jgi:hypothetical protein
LDVIFTPEPGRKEKKRSTLDDKDVIIFGFDVRNEPVAMFEHLSSRGFVEQTFRAGAMAREAEHKKRHQRCSATDEQCAAPTQRPGIYCCSQLNPNHGHDEQHASGDPAAPTSGDELPPPFSTTSSARFKYSMHIPAVSWWPAVQRKWDRYVGNGSWLCGNWVTSAFDTYGSDFRLTPGSRHSFALHQVTLRATTSPLIF